MPKPDWSTDDKKGWLSDPPLIPEDVNGIESFLVFTTYSSGTAWWAGHKTYSTLWSALRFGMSLGRHSHHQNYVKNLQTNEIVWRSWEDENPYRG